jgi:glycosyltransferase involved in cell wall biosynthesis
MPKILFLTVHRPNRSPSQRFRFEQYLPYLKEKGFECNHFFLLDEKADKIFYSHGKIISKLFLAIKSAQKLFKLTLQANDYDFIFIQRECFMLGTSYFEKRFSKSKAKLIYDFDDSIWLLDVSNANKAFAWLKNPDKTSKIITLSDIVVAGNSYLAAYAKQFNQNIKLIPTTVDTDLYFRKKSNQGDKICIGWSGSLTTIKHFETAIPVLKKLKSKYGDKLIIKVMGDENYTNNDLGINGIKWSSETELEELSTFDIGIMPLPNDQWAKGKCGLKGLLYMSIEIPTIMSPVGVNTEIINDGENGFLATSDEEWINKLSALIESKTLREKIGKAGRDTVVNKFSVESQKSNYLALFK